jgi:hypothetical protein
MHMGSRVILTYIISTMLHKHMHRAKFEKCYTFKITSCQNLKICEISKGVSKNYSLKFPLEVTFRTGACGTLSLAFLSL